MNKAKEKNKKKNTKDKNLLDLDNEIIIGIKTLPEPEIPKRKRTTNKKEEKKKELNIKLEKEITKNNRKKNKNLEKSSNKKKVQKTNSKEKNKKQDDEIELKLGIEDESVKKKNAKNKAKTKKKPKKTAKQLEREKKKRRHIFRFIKWTTLITLIIGVGIYFLLSPYFNIKSITTNGNKKITSEEIISLSGIQLEENMFKISRSKVEQLIKTNAYIESVDLKRKLPDSIEIQVVERKPAYMLMLGNAYVYINSQGYILELSKEKLELPIITGFSTVEDQIQVGNRLNTEDLEKLSSVIQIMDSANSNELGSLITKINIEDKQDYVLELESEDKTVHLGDTSNLSTKMLYIKTVLENEKDKEGEILVNTDLNSKGAIFREKV